jgi:hypothetical protein
VPPKLTIKKMQTLASSRGGKCLSIDYIDNKTKLQWQCAKGHKWRSTAISVKNTGHWCPVCSGHIGTIEQMQEIAKSRSGKCLSTEYINSRIKLQWQCTEGHRWWATPAYIKKKCWCPTCNGTGKATIEEMQVLAKSKGGKCLSAQYVNDRTKLQWQCAEGHMWWTTPNIIKRNHWCLKCAGYEKGTIEEMQEIAKSRGGKCLSAEYINNMTHLQWQCAKGHRWRAIPFSIKVAHSWCPKCAVNEKKTIEEMQDIAKSKGGLCLSKKYINTATKLQWECAKGHRWLAVPAQIKDSWCPMCSHNRKKTLEDMQALARSKGGECISKKYVNIKTPLKWKCNRGHIWTSLYLYINRNENFCPTCRRYHSRWKQWQNH